jgi:hypothetical protein
MIDRPLAIIDGRMLFALLAAAAVTTGQVQRLATPLPVLLPATAPGTAYYIMQGSAIVSRPFSTASDCMKALAKVKNPALPATNALVCAHRHP